MVALKRYRSRAVVLLLALMALPGPAIASDFSLLMWLLLIPCAIYSGLVWLITWLCTAHLKPPWMKTTIRVVGACLVLTPTHTRGGNGQPLSIAAYDMVLSAFGGDPVYALQALINAGIASVLVLAIVLPTRHYARRNKGNGDN